MVLAEDSDDHLFKKHQELCNKLNLDPKTASQAWDSFQKIRTNYTVEGDPLHWLGCAVFVACRRTSTPTVGRTLVEGNFVSLTSLLRYCNLSLTHFFNKITKWADMANMPDEFKKSIGRLEGNFAVSYNIFKKFTPIFNEIFKNSIEIEPSKHRSRKQRTQPCTPTKVFEFCWILFTTVKAEDPSYSEDLVISYHLLQACCDLAFKNAFLEDRRDLLNPNFAGLPPNWSLPEYTVPQEAPCIIDLLCLNHNGIPTEAKYVKEYSWRTHIRSLFNREVLQGNENNFTGLFDPSNFDQNFKNITKAYEAHLLNRGDFDERIFLAEYRRRLLLKEQAVTNTIWPVPFSPLNESGDAIVTDSPRGNQFGESLSAPCTPISNKKYNSMRFQGDVTPLVTATQSVARLQTLLAGRQAGPSEALQQIFKTCAKDPAERIKQVVERLGDKFCAEFTQQNLSLPSVQPDYANQRLQFAVTLFYKFIENIFQKERTIHKDISHLAEKDVFYECTLACSLEIVIYSYNSQRKFPWILYALDIQPFYFVRVIELIVRSQDQLPRDAVKHLNMVEQTIIESLIWKSDSPVWDALTNSGDSFPKFQDTALPGNMVYTEEEASSSNSQNADRSLTPSESPSAVDRFQSPITSQVKKQLFGNNSVRPGQSLLQNTKPVATHLIVTDNAGNRKLIALAETSMETIVSSPPGDPMPPIIRPKRTGSLAILLRKFYNLAGSRLEHLCNLLAINDLEFRRKIWTVFEHSVREYTHLMKDRHLDQLLMCAVYVICKVSGRVEKSFTEIMRCYRDQPQADSHIYRNVLINRSSSGSEGSNSGHGTPDQSLSAESEERGDLISFYNTVYVQAIRNFALRFSTGSNQNMNILLSPLPLLANSKLVSPRYQITNNVFITSYDSPSNSMNKGQTLEYHFSRSPSKDLEKINNAINKGIRGKRLLADDDDMASNKRCATKKVQSFFEERRSHAQ